jgi:hypothetical protein
MKNPLAILILLAAFAASCQMDNKISAENSTGSETRIEPLVSPTPINSPAAETILINDIDSKIGIADIHGDGTGCLRTKRGDLDAQTPVSIIFSLDEPPQKILSAKVEKKLDKSCARRASETGDKNLGENYFYSLTYERADESEIAFDVGIAVIKPAKAIQIQENLASVDLDEDGKSEFFRRCMGFEGIHFTIWTGKPLKGKRIWHSFYYLDYDTKADCRKKDWKGTEDF